MYSIINNITYILPIILFIVFCMKKATKELWVAFFYLIFSISIDFVTTSNNFGRNHRTAIWGVDTIIEFSFLTIFFYLSSNNQFLTRATKIIGPIILSVIIYSFLKSDKEIFDSTAQFLESITLIIFSISFFFGELNKPQPYSIFSSPNFWIVLAILIYMSSTLFLFIIVNHLSPEQREKYCTLPKNTSYERRM